MKIKIKGGPEIEFPDSMSMEQIKAALDRKYRPNAATTDVGPFAGGYGMPDTAPSHYLSGGGPVGPMAASHESPNPIFIDSGYQGAAFQTPRPSTLAPPSQEYAIDQAMRQRRMELFGREQHPDDILFDRSAPAAERYRRARERTQDVGRDWINKVAGKVPFAGMATKGVQDLDYLRLKQKLDEGTASFTDVMQLAHYDRQRELDAQQGWGASAVDMLTDMPAYMAEFYFTGPAAKLMSRVVRGAAAGEKILTVGGHVSDVTAQSLVRAALLPGYGASEYAKYRGKGESESAAFVKGFSASAVEFASEMIGAKIPAPAFMKKIDDWVKSPVAKGGLGKAARYATALGKAGYDGPIAESLEERFSEIIKGLALDNGGFEGVTGDMVAGAFRDAGSQLLKEFVVFSVPGLMGMGAKDDGPQYQPTRDQKDNTIYGQDLRPRALVPYGSEPSVPQYEPPTEQYQPTRNEFEPTEQYGPYEKVLPQRVWDQYRNDPAAFFDTFPEKVSAYANADPSLSRSAFSKATGMPRELSSKARRQPFVEEARRRPKPTDLTQSPPPASLGDPSLAPAKKIITNLAKASPSNAARFFRQPEMAQWFRDGLQSHFSAGELASTFGYAKGKYRKKELIDKIVDRYQSLATRPAAQEQTTRPVEDIPRQQYQPTREQFDPTEQYQPTRGQYVPAEPAPPPMTPAVQAVYDQLSDDKSELESLAAMMGVVLPKKGTKARRAITAAQLRRDVAEAMANPAARKGLAGDIPAQRRPPTPPAKELPSAKVARSLDKATEGGDVSTQVSEETFQLSREPAPPEPTEAEPEPAPVQQSFISGRGRDLPGQKTFVDVDGLDGGTEAQEEAPKVKSKGVKFAGEDTSAFDSSRDTSDAAVAEGMERLRKYGFKPKKVSGKDAVHKDIEEWAKRFGVRVVWTSHTVAKGRWKYAGFSHKGIAFVDAKAPIDSLWNAASHEIAHASNMDQLHSEFPLEVVEKYAKQFYDEAPKGIKEMLDENKDMYYREGVATLIGEFMRDSKVRTAFRESTDPAKRSVWKTILDKVFQVLGAGPYKSKEFATVDRILKREMDKPEYSIESARESVRAALAADIELGQAKPEDMEGAVDQVMAQVMRRHAEVSEQVKARNEAVKYIKRSLRLNKVQVAKINNKSDAASIPKIDEIGRDAASLYPSAFEGIRPSEEGAQEEAYGEAAFNLIVEGEMPEPKMDDDRILTDILLDIGQDQARYEKALDSLMKEVKSGKNAELFESIKESLPDDIQDKDRAALQALQQLIAQGDDDMPFMPKKGQQDLAGPEDFKDPVLRRIAEIPGALDLARKLFKRKDKKPLLDELNTLRAFSRASPGTTQAGREQIFARDLEAGLEGTGNPARSHTWAQSKARDLINAKGYRHYIKQFANRFRNQGFYFKDVLETQIAREIIDHLSVAKLLSGTEQEIQDFRDLLDGYRAARSMQAASLSMRDPIITNQRTVYNKAINEMVIAKDPKIRKRIIDQLRKNDIDLSDPELFKDHRKVIRVIAIARNNTPGTIGDMLYEFYLNSILSGPQTWAANAVGGLNAMWGLTVEQWAETALQSLPIPGVRSPENVTDPRELVYMYKGVGSAMGKALTNSLRSWWWEYSPLNFEVDTRLDPKTNAAWGLNMRAHAIPGKLGGGVRAMAFRTLQATDEFVRTLAAHGMAAKHAFRIAKAEGLSGDALAQRISQLTLDKSSDAWTAGMVEANYLAFQQEGGEISKQTKAMFRQLKSNRLLGRIFQYVIPFDNFLVNSFSRASDLMPFTGLVSAVVNDVMFNKSGGKKGIKANWAHVLGNQLLGMAAGFLVSEFMDDEDENGLPRITGTRERNLAGRSLQYRSAPPLSIRINGKYYSYSRIEPFNVFISTMVDLNHALRDKDTNLIAAAWRSAMNQVQDKNYMQGFSDLASIAEREGNAMDLITNTAIGFVPNIYRQPMREARNKVAETRFKVTDTWSEWRDKLLTKVELAGTGPLLRYDVWGRPLQPNSPQTSLPFRILSPVKVKDVEEVLPVDVAIYQYNELHPDAPYNPGAPEPPKSLGKMSVEEFVTYARERGAFARGIVDQMEFTSPPTDGQIAGIKRALRKGTDVATKRIAARRRGAQLDPL